ncbi:uncharacterized protein [Eurosta solidaginis]|uniref:uncharacterized protein isoform X2 n=1 Tax=Eurosta solidaginis TaxID=178769 RepID=UPI003531190F
MSSLVFIVSLLLGCKYVLSCQITIRGQSPIFTKDFGSKTIVFRAHSNILTLDDGESIRAHCRGITVSALSTTSSTQDQYEYEAYEEGNRQIKQRIDISSALKDTEVFTCESNSLKILGTSYENVQVFCPDYPRLRLYESQKKLPKCTNFTSYAFGFKLQETGDIIKSAVCYDLDHLELKFASYVTYEKKVMVYKKVNVGNELSLNLKQELNGFSKYFAFLNERSGNVVALSTKSPFSANEFEFDSIIQDESLKIELYDFKYIFNIMWWRQLRQENWHFFLDALTERTQTVKYMVNVGTFGNVTIPAAQENCTSSKNQVVSIANEDMIIKAPGYIWTYLKSITPGVEEEFVIIGHNSPYKENPDHSEFCEVDKCEEIEWLKNSMFARLRHLPSLGYTFCCSAEEVAKKIDYIPFKATEIVTSTQEIPIPEYIPSNWIASRTRRFYMAMAETQSGEVISTLFVN